MSHTSSSPHFNGQHSAAKDWSVLAGGGTIPNSQPVKPKWAIPEPENEYVKFNGLQGFTRFLQQIKKTRRCLSFQCP